MSMMPTDPLMTAQQHGLSRLIAGDTGQQPKGDVDYRVSDDPAESCSTCVHFDGQQGCEVVAGTIHPDGVSNAWEPAPMDQVAATETEAEAPSA